MTIYKEMGKKDLEDVVIYTKEKKRRLKKYLPSLVDDLP